MIDFNNVTFAYDNKKTVLDNVTFSVKKGEKVGIIGANAAGKSTLMKALLGLIDYRGSIEVDGVLVNKNNLSKIRKACGFVLQDSDSQMFMPTVLEDMIFGPVNYGKTRDEAEKIAYKVLNQLGLSHLKNRKNYRMSGGEKRMAAIATILAMEPEVLIMDEPSTALDPYNRRRLINLLKEIDCTKIIVSHDLDMILETCDRVILLSDGKVVADDTTGKILWNEKMLLDNHLELPLCIAGVPSNIAK